MKNGVKEEPTTLGDILDAKTKDREINGDTCVRS